MDDDDSAADDDDSATVDDDDDSSRECPEGEVEDCNGNCGPEEWIGDFFCDDGAYLWDDIPIVFDCDEFNRDDGDCEPRQDVPCGDGLVPDCNGYCAPQEWIGDSTCDDGQYLFDGVPIDFNCADGAWDGGDCDDGMVCDRPDVVVFSVSGHDISDSNDLNEEYLYERGAVLQVANALPAGTDVMLLPYADELENSRGEGDTIETYGFLQLQSDLEFVSQNWGGLCSAPPAVIIIAHSHGVVWSHTAVHMLPGLYVDVLVDLDGQSDGWERPYWGLVGDHWAHELQAFADDYGPSWPFSPWDAANAAQWGYQDVEDVVPWNVGLNLEVASDPSVLDMVGKVGFVLTDRDPNSRTDGSTTGIYREEFSGLSHSEVSYDDTAALNWVAEEIYFHFAP